MPAGSLDLAKPLRPGFWREILQPAEHRPQIGIERLREQRMHLLHAAAFDLQHGFNHGTIEGRAFGEAAVQFNVLCACKRRLHRSVEAIDRGVVEDDGGALRDTRQSHHAGAGRAPVHRHRGLLAAIVDRCRRGKFRDQQFRIIDLRHDKNLAELCGDRRLRRGLRRERHADAVAADFQAERKAGHRALRAIIDPPGFRLAGAPGVGCTIDLGSRIKPERAPAQGGDNEQHGHNEKAPKRAPARREADIGHAATFG